MSRDTSLVIGWIIAAIGAGYFIAEVFAILFF